MGTIEFQNLSGTSIITVEGDYSFESLRAALLAHTYAISYKGIQYNIGGIYKLVAKDLVVFSVLACTHPHPNPMVLENYFNLGTTSSPKPNAFACTCGSESVGSEKHSNWCDLEQIRSLKY